MVGSEKFINTQVGSDRFTTAEVASDQFVTRIGRKMGQFFDPGAGIVTLWVRNHVYVVSIR